MNNKQLTILKDITKHSKKYNQASKGMITTNIEFFTSYNGFKLTEQEKAEVFTQFAKSTHLVITE